VEPSSLLVVEIIALIIEHKIQDRSLGKIGGLVQDEPMIGNTSSKRHTPTLQGQKAASQVLLLHADRLL